MQTFSSDEKFLLWCDRDITEEESKQIIPLLKEKTTKDYKKILRFTLLESGIRIVLHQGGFGLFIPSKLWRKYDVSVDKWLVMMEKECFLADKSFAFSKFDIDPLHLESKLAKTYGSDDLKVRLETIKTFALNNFVNGVQLYPESDYFTIGSYLDAPQVPRPFRIRLGGPFKLKF